MKTKKYSLNLLIYNILCVIISREPFKTCVAPHRIPQKTNYFSIKY